MAHHHHDTSKGLTLAFWLNLGFSIIEIIGGIFTNSTAIIADAFHDFMDAFAIGAAVYLEKVAKKKRTSQFTYGYKRFSLLAAIGISITLLVGAVMMLTSGIKTFINPSEVNSVGMLWLAVLGLAINGFAFLKIKNGNTGHHAHSHAHSHSHNSKAIMLHLLEDVLGWAAVLIGAAVIYYTGWFWIDGVLAIGIALFIGYNACKNLYETVKIVLQSVPENVDLKKLESDLNATSGVKRIHDLHVWSLDGSYHLGSIHVVVDNPDEQLRSNLRGRLHKVMEQHHIVHPTIQLEQPTEVCKLVNC